MSSEPPVHSPLQSDPTNDVEEPPRTPEISQRRETPSPAEPICISQAHDPETSSLSHRVRVLEQLLQQSEHSNRQTSSTKDLEARLSKIERRIEGWPYDPRPPDKSELRIKLPRPHLRAEHEKTRLFGKTHWVHSLDQFNILSQMQSRPYSVVDGVQIAASAPMVEAAIARRRAKTHGAKLLQEPMPALRESIPAKDICDQAIDGYLRTYEPMFRILHVPSFMAEYEGSWSQAEPVQTEFLMKLTMVLTIGAMFLRDRSVANEIKRTARNWVYAVQWWLTGPTERDAMSLDGIQVFCLLILARQTSALGGTASIMTEALSKLSFTLGLHVDPRFHPSVTPFESEMRRRLWLTVLELTAITSLNSTLPLLLHGGDYHVPLPSNTADSKLCANEEAPETSRQQQYTQHENLDCSVQLMLAKSLRLRTQIIQELNDGSREAIYGKVIALSNTLQTHCREMAVFFHQQQQQQQPDEPRDQAPPTPNFQHKFLDTYFRRLILFLHRPFANQARRDHRYLLSRKTCLESSLVMATHTETMDLGSGLLDDFSACCISGGGMFKGALGQDIILSISLEIVTQLEEENSLNTSTPLTTSTSDPLALLAHTHRKPLLRYLEHVRTQWRHVIRLGRPSLKQYLFVSCILRHIAALESGGARETTTTPKTAVFLETVKRALRECSALLREAPAYAYAYAGVDEDGDEGAAEWRDGDGGGGGGGGGDGAYLSSPDAIDAMALFGFDFGALDSAFAMDLPVWADTPSTADVQNFM